MSSCVLYRSVMFLLLCIFATPSYAQDIWTSLPVAISEGDGSFHLEDHPIGDFAGWMATDDVEVIDGDFDGDGRTDLALIRRSFGWTTMPIAFSGEDGFTITNHPAEVLTNWIRRNGTEVITGDFNADSRTDLVLVNHMAGWTTIPMALSNGDGSFRIINRSVDSFPGWITTSGVTVVADDFNGDHRTDLTLVRLEPGWKTMPSALMTPDTTFQIVNVPAEPFTGWAAATNVDVVSGDFNGDSMADLALVRQQAGWKTMPLAYARGDGTFRLENLNVGSLPAWIARNDVEVIVEDFNGDGLSDFALLRYGYGWTTIPMAFAQRDAGFRIVNMPIEHFPGWLAEEGVNAVPGDFNGDGTTDLALIRLTAGWTTIPIGLSRGDGTFNVVNHPAGRFTQWVTEYGVECLPGDFNGDGKTDLFLVRPGPPEEVLEVVPE